MTTHRRHTPKHRAWAAPRTTHRATMPDALRQCAKVRARKPVPCCNVLNFVQHPNTKEDEIHLHTHPPPPPYPPIPYHPLVAPAAWRSLPRKLVRPSMADVDPANIASAQPAYAGIAPSSVRQGWTWIGYKVLGMYQKLWVDPPKVALPTTYNVIVKDLGLATCATHIFAVYPYASSAQRNPVARQFVKGRSMYRREVALFPTHAAIWAAHCARLPRLNRADVPMRLVRPEGEKGAASVIRLPVVPLALPFPPAFFAIELYVYTSLKRLFIGHLLPCPDLTEKWVKTAVVGGECFERIVGDLSRTYNLRGLCRLAKHVHGAYQNMLVLGMVDDGIWEGLDFAWQVVLKALEIVDERERNAAR